MSQITMLVDGLKSNLCELEAELPAKNLPYLWDPQPYEELDNPEALPSHKAFSLIEKIKTDLKAIEALVTPNHFKLFELGNLQFKVAALNAAVTLDLAGELSKLGGQASLHELAEKVNANEHKLGRILRTLAAEYIFQEVSPDVFKHTRHSTALAGFGARSFLTFITDLGMKAATGITSDLKQPETRDSFEENTAPFLKVVSQDGRTFAQYLMDSGNPETVALVTEGVVGWLNRLTRAGLLSDYPWAELGNSTVVDVGCGPGDSGIDVLHEYPQLNWIFQDFGHVIEQVKKTFPGDLQGKIDNGSISFVEQDYFQPNVSKGNVWYLRGVLHEYDDEALLKILSHLTSAMQNTPGSKMLINEVLNSSPTRVPANARGPPSTYIPQKQSALADLANTVTWGTFALFGGKERSMEEYEKLLHKAGLKVTRFFKFRTFTVMIECELA